MRFSLMEPTEAAQAVSDAWPPLMDILPSVNDPTFDKVIIDFTARQEYIKQFGFVAISKELVEEMVKKFSELDVDRFVELQAGTGFLCKVLIDAGLKGIGYSLPVVSPEEAKETGAHCWGLTESPMYKFCVKEGILELVDIRDLRIFVPKMVISSWVPLGGGEEVIEFFDNNGYPEYYTVIGEGWGGCTAGDTYHEWLTENYESVEYIGAHKPFEFIRDDILIYKLKESKKHKGDSYDRI